MVLDGFMPTFQTAVKEARSPESREREGERRVGREYEKLHPFVKVAFLDDFQIDLSRRLEVIIGAYS